MKKGKKGRGRGKYGGWVDSIFRVFFSPHLSGRKGEREEVV